MKIHPYYDRSDLVKLTTDTVEGNLLRGMVLVLIVLIFFLVSLRAAVIVALTIPLSLLFAFIILHAHDGAANLLSIGAIDFGIIIDGTVVMVENIYRELASAHRRELQPARSYSRLRRKMSTAQSSIRLPSSSPVISRSMRSPALRRNCSIRWPRPCLSHWSAR